jgi:hypothetical protein
MDEPVARPGLYETLSSIGKVLQQQITAAQNAIHRKYPRRPVARPAPQIIRPDLDEGLALSVRRG